ncbi:MAG: LD-carboxypeptidase [Bacteroidetes bacterium MedPE-SWsnd-G2]|nr:MAG: LD-carboxypeptidase [Bacteroidetes bacterium MedPE-SWsnd-G2]
MSNAQNTMKNTLKVQPPFLKTGDTVAIVAPSGILKHQTEEINRAKQLLSNWGLNVVIGENLWTQNGHFAGTDEERCADFQKALDDPNIKAIWCARGGYGSVRILDMLDYSKFLDQPKWIVGYSDITAIHNQVHLKGVQSIHAMMCVNLTDTMTMDNPTVLSLGAALFGKELSYSLKGSSYNKVGKCSGELVGGNLTMLHSMLGSDTSLTVDGEILFIEEIGEYAYHIDRMLQSLKRAGYFENCKGLLVGDISKVRKNTTEFGRTIEEIILDVVAEYNFPVAFNMPAGHEKINEALFLGRQIELVVSKSGSTLSYK